jgi:hypothetical protein
MHPSGASTTYFNPALLGEAPEGVHLGITATELDFQIDYGERPDGVDIGDSIFGASVQNEDGGSSELERKPLPTDQLPARGNEEPGEFEAHLNAGFVHQLIDDTLTLGVTAQIPTSSFIAQEPHYVDEREQYFSNSLHFARYSDRLTSPSFAGALGVEPTEWVSIGFGIENFTKAVTVTDIFLPNLINRSQVYINADTRIDISFIPYGSIAFTPLDTWVFSGTFHAPYSTKVDGESRLTVWGPEESDLSQINQSFDFTYDYLPARFGLGAKKSFVDLNLDLAAFVRWKQWSQYKNRHRGTESDWDNTYTASASAKWSGDGQSLGLSMDYEPTPVPEQRGRTNYVDNDRLGGAVGYSHRLELGEVAFDVGLNLQSHILFERSHEKSPSADDPVIDEYPTSIDPGTGEVIEESRGLQTNNPGFPGFSSSGWIHSGGVHLSKRF